MIGFSMTSNRFTLKAERLVQLPSYRWLSIMPFDIDLRAVPLLPEALFAALMRDPVFLRPYIFRGDVHGPFPAGEIRTTDYERVSGAEARRRIVDKANSRASWMDAPDPPPQPVMEEAERAISAWPDAAAGFHLRVDCYLEAARRHDVGWVLWEFDEHIILDAEHGRGWFAVLGMD